MPTAPHMACGGAGYDASACIGWFLVPLKKSVRCTSWSLKDSCRCRVSSCRCASAWKGWCSCVEEAVVSCTSLRWSSAFSFSAASSLERTIEIVPSWLPTLQGQLRSNLL